jgi:hypothetical protein
LPTVSAWRPVSTRTEPPWTDGLRWGSGMSR